MRVSSRRRLVVAPLLLLPCAASGRGSVDDAARDRPTGTSVLQVPSLAMAPTIPVGTRILVRHLDADEPVRVGEIVVVNAPSTATSPGTDATCVERRSVEQGRPCRRGIGGRSRTRFVKRIVAGPGDTVAFERGRTIRNGRDAGERFLSDTCDRADEPVPSCDLPRPITLGRDDWFLAGDNRGEAADSRDWGPVPRAWILSRVVRIGDARAPR